MIAWWRAISQRSTAPYARAWLLAGLFAVLASGLAGCNDSADRTNEQTRDRFVEESRKRIADITEKMKQDVIRQKSEKPFYYRLRTGEIFAIPSKHQQYWLNRDHAPKALFPLERIPVQDAIGFGFFLPSFGGYDENNFTSLLGENGRVQVDIESASLDSIRKSPPRYGNTTLIREYLGGGIEATPFARHGLECFRLAKEPRFSYCFGRRPNGQELVWRVTDGDDKIFVNPISMVEYHSAQLADGVLVRIRLNTSHLDKWQVVDDFIWAKLREWQVKPGRLE